MIKIRVWFSTGFADGQREYFTDTDELNIPEEEWEGMGGVDKDDVLREIAFSQIDWGYEETPQGEA